MTQLSERGLVPEDWGGENLFVNVSAHTGEGVDALLDSILLQAELMDLKAVAEGPAHGLVIESSLEKGRGAVATLLVQGGTLKHARNFDFPGIGVWDQAPEVVLCDPDEGVRYGFVTSRGAGQRRPIWPSRSSWQR